MGTVNWDKIPNTSLGPKPTKKQMEQLKKLAEPGVVLRFWTGTSINSHGAYLDWTLRTDKRVTEKMNEGEAHKYVKWGWVTCTETDWKGNSYTISDSGKKRIEMGETR